MLTRASGIAFRQALFKANTVSQKIATCRYIHVIRQVRKPPRSSLLDLHRNCRVVGVPLVRYASTNETAQSTSPETISPQTAAPQTSPFDEIPDPPTPIEEIIENIVKLHPNGEPTLESMGLGGYTPVGLVQQALEFLHISCGLPWWSTIFIGTLCARTLIFPLVIKSQRNAINFSNHMPKIQELQMRMTEARNSGDYMESARSGTELMQYMKTNNISALKNFMTPLVQAPIFVSFFIALRKMANTPVESLKQGGFWWVTDLTIHDPYYIMPIVTCVTMYLTIEIGADGMNVKTMGMMRYVVRALPFVLLPFMINFPGTILTYWMSTNFISLVQTSVLKIPYMRKKLNMPSPITHAPSALPKSNKGFLEGIKESYTNIKITKQLDRRERADAIQFSKAGRGPLVKTFKSDPTKLKASNIYAKQR